MKSIRLTEERAVLFGFTASTWEAAWGGQTGSLSHSSWLRVGRGTDRLNSNGEKCRQCIAHQLLLFSFSILCFFKSSIQCASVCCAVPNVVLHKIMIMPECVEDGSTCQYIWHFEESGFDAIRSKMFETHNRRGIHLSGVNSENHTIIE